MQLSSLIQARTSLGPILPRGAGSPAPATQSAPPASSPSYREEKRALFAEAEKADADFENAKQVADAMLMARSQVIKNILLTCGKGPFMYKGESVRIIKRKSQDGKREVYFFRAVSKTEPEDID